MSENENEIIVVLIFLSLFCADARAIFMSPRVSHIISILEAFVSTATLDVCISPTLFFRDLNNLVFIANK